MFHTHFFLDIRRRLNSAVRLSELLRDPDEALDEGVFEPECAAPRSSGQGDDRCSPGVTVRIVDLMACPNDLMELFLD